MTYFCWFIFAVISVLVTADPKVFYLKDYIISETWLRGAEMKGKLYVASNDDLTLLRNIVITTGSTSTTLDKLADINSDGTPKSLQINGDPLLQTTNNETITKSLTGYIYCTTYEQAHDERFAVYVITESQIISRMEGRSTTVVLNTAYKNEEADAYAPLKTSYVTGINHSPNTNLYFSWGVPSVNHTFETDRMFYKNPLVFNNYDEHGKLYNWTKVFFDNVEPLQIGIDFWYFESIGPVNMQIENKYERVANYTTTAVNTTGLIVNNFLFESHQVNFNWDSTRQSFVGTLISTVNLTSPVEFLLDGGGIVDQTFTSSQTPVLSESQFPAARLLVKSTDLTPGTFFCQYYGFSGDVLPGTATSPTTPVPVTTPPGNGATSTTVQSTTKASSQSLTIIDLSLTTFLVYAIFN